MTFAVRLIVAAGGALVLLGGLHAALAPDHARRNLEYFPDMGHSPALESQGVSSSFADGLGQQPLVAGVVPRGSLPFRYAATDEDALRAGRELVSPFASDDTAALARGGEIYGIHCVHCHDPAGNGLGSAVQRGMLQPPSLLAARAVEMADGQVFHVLTRGQGNMPSFAAQLVPGDRWRVILHLRALQKGGEK